MPVKTGPKKNPGARVPTGPTTPLWMKMARHENLKLELVLSDDNGDILESIPVSWNRLEELDLNLKPLERYVTTHYPEETAGEKTTTGRHVA
jgi:hypothetical protein